MGLVRRILALFLALALPALALGQPVPTGQRMPVTVTDTAGNPVNVGDSANNAARVNVVAGGAGDGKILDGNGAGEADVINSATGGTEYGLVVRCASGCAGSGGTSSSYGSAFPATGTAGGFSDGTNMQGARVYDTDSGAGAQYTLGVNLRFSGAGGSVEAGTASNPLRTDPTGTTTQPVSGTVTANAAQSGTWTVQPGNTANTTPWLVKPPAGTPLLENNLSTTVQTVVGSAATLDSYFCYNPNASVAYVQIFDISGAVTLGTSTPKWSIGIPATASGNLSQINLGFANAIKVAATTTATGSTAPGTALDCNFGYR